MGSGPARKEGRKDGKKLVIFDLDDVLLDTTKNLERIRILTVEAMMRKGLPGKDPKRIVRIWYEKIARKDSNNPRQLNELCEIFRITDDPKRFTSENNRIVAAGRLAYHKAKLDLLKPDKRVDALLAHAMKIGYVAIVTRGDVERQWEKIYLLGLDKLVGKENVFIISNDDMRRKSDVYRFLIKKYRARPDSSFVVDDRSSGIDDANEAGLKSILYLNKRGNYYKRSLDDLREGRIAPYRIIRRLDEIKKIIE